MVREKRGNCVQFSFFRDFLRLRNDPDLTEFAIGHQEPGTFPGSCCPYGILSLHSLVYGETVVFQRFNRMKKGSLIAGLFLGAILGVGLTRVLSPAGATSKIDSVPWPWADSLDAVKAAPKNHHIVFENDKIRILEVTLGPFEYEQMHTHQHPSVMFGADSRDTFGSTIIYYRNGYDSLHHKYLVKDSFTQNSGPQNPDEPNTGHYMKPEGPHQIKNLSNVKIAFFRVEFKS